MRTGPVTYNILTILITHNLRDEYPILLPAEKPSKLLYLGYTIDIMQHRIDCTPDREWSFGFTSIYTEFNDPIIYKINREFATGRIVPMESSTTLSIFTQPKSDKLSDARFLLNCILRNLATYKDKTQRIRKAQIMDFVGSRTFRRKLHLRDRYYNISIYQKSIPNSTLYCHMAEYDSLVIQQRDCNWLTTIIYYGGPINLWKKCGLIDTGRG